MGKLIEAPIDGTNINDCFPELFSDITDFVYGRYNAGGDGRFYFLLNEDDSKLIFFDHSMYSNRLYFYTLDFLATRRDIDEVEEFIKGWSEIDGLGHRIVAKCNRDVFYDNDLDVYLYFEEV